VADLLVDTKDVIPVCSLLVQARTRSSLLSARRSSERDRHDRFRKGVGRVTAHVSMGLPQADLRGAGITLEQKWAEWNCSRRGRSVLRG
jgi:hypothetical protein